MNRLFTLLLAVVLKTAYCDTILSADVDGNYLLDSLSGPFIVADEVTVNKGCSMRIGPGCILLFKPFSGITVDGSLAVEGTREHPVIFTSIRDLSNNLQAEEGPAAPFDWNGLTISVKAGKVNLTNFLLSYSVFGIKSKKENIRIDNGLFFSNGQFHFTINDQIQPVKENFPYSCNTDEASPESPDPVASASRTKSPTLALILSGVVPGSGLAYMKKWPWGATYAVVFIGAAVSSILLGKRDEGETCGSCNGFKDGNIVHWNGCIDGEWDTRSAVFSERTFFGQVAVRQEWEETYGGSAEHREGLFIPNLALLGVGCAVYITNLIHTGVTAGRIKNNRRFPFSPTTDIGSSRWE